MRLFGVLEGATTSEKRSSLWAGGCKTLTIKSNCEVVLNWSGLVSDRSGLTFESFMGSRGYSGHDNTLKFIGSYNISEFCGWKGIGRNKEEVLARIGEILRRLGEVLGRLGEVLGRLGELLGRLGEVLEWSLGTLVEVLGHPGQLLMLLGRVLGRSRGVLGRS